MSALLSSHALSLSRREAPMSLRRDAACCQHLQNIWLIQRQRLSHRRLDLLRTSNTLAGDAHPMGNFDKVQRRVGQIQVGVGTPGRDIERAPIAVRVELQDTIGTIAQDNVDDRDMVMCGCPKALHRVHRRAISDQGHDGSVWIGELHSQGSWQTLTNATAVIAKDAPWLLQWDGAQEITRGRDRLVKEYRVGRQAHT